MGNFQVKRPLIGWTSERLAGGVGAPRRASRSRASAARSWFADIVANENLVPTNEIDEIARKVAEQPCQWPVFLEKLIPSHDGHNPTTVPSILHSHPETQRVAHARLPAITPPHHMIVLSTHAAAGHMGMC